MVTKITFYGGVGEIGGNKFLVEDRGTRIFLDFGMQMAKANDFFNLFVQPRACNALHDLFEFELLPKLKGLYRRDYSKHMNFGGSEATEYDAILLTHAHADHAAYIHYLRPDIPVYCSEATELLLQASQDTTGDEYINCKQKFQKDKKKNAIRRKVITFKNSEAFSIDSIEVQPLRLDHSIPGVCGFILRTSDRCIGYTADFRFHGRRKADSDNFVTMCQKSKLDILLCEGTRIDKRGPSQEEEEIENKITAIANQTRKLVVCTYPARDLDRLLSFYTAALKSKRDLVIDLRQAYILKLFHSSESLNAYNYPRPDDKRIKIYVPKKQRCLIDKQGKYWTKKDLLADYMTWERQFLDYNNSVDWRDVKAHQKEYIFYCSDFHLQELIDIKPDIGSIYIRSSTEPFNDEMQLDQKRVKRWLAHFKLLTNEKAQWHSTHVSGHGSGDQIKKVIQESNAECIVPIHTKNEEPYKKWHNNVKQVVLNKTI